MVEKTQVGTVPQSVDGEQDTPKEYLTKEEFNIALNNAISNRLKSFEKKMEELMSKSGPKQEIVEEKDLTQREQLKTVQQQLAAIKAERDSEVSKRRDSELKAQLKDHLTKAGVPAHLLKAAMATINEDKLVDYNEDNEIVFNTKEGPIDLSSGLKGWSKSEDGKVFMAPKGTMGSGDRSYSSSAPKSGQTLTEGNIAEMLLSYRHDG